MKTLLNYYKRNPPGTLEENRIYSYFGLTPSIDFTGEQYQFFLHFASSEELEKDIVTKKTVVKIAEMLGKDLTKWGWNFWDT